MKSMNVVFTPKMASRISLLFLPLFIIACSDSNITSNEVGKKDIVRVPIELKPEHTLKEATIETIENPDYSPGGESWNLPTEEELEAWDHKQYLNRLNAWASQTLARWTCNTCKSPLNKDFKYVSRDFSSNTAVFKCKCDCGYEHTVTLPTTRAVDP